MVRTVSAASAANSSTIIAIAISPFIFIGRKSRVDAKVGKRSLARNSKPPATSITSKPSAAI